MSEEKLTPSTQNNGEVKYQLSASDISASKELILELSLELANKSHTWSNELRSKFERVISVLDKA
jgi:hypothetical protein